MKQFITIFLVLVSFSSIAQSAEEYLQKGIAKHNQQDYAGAIKEYDLAIKARKDFRDAYYNRGTCELALQDLKAAKADFDKTIQIDPAFAKAYYSRATILVSQEKYADALPDLDKTIDLDPATPNALNLRGQILAQSGNKDSACLDFNRAKELGDTNADKYLAKFCSNEPHQGESLLLDWPAGENWKVASNQKDGNMSMIELIHSNETLDNWTEMGNMMSIKGITGISMEKAMNLMLDQAKESAPQAKLTFIEKDESVEYPWVIFTIESPGFKNDKNPESQLWYIVQGKEALYTNFIAIKKAEIPEDFQAKWIRFFKTAKVVNK